LAIGKKSLIQKLTKTLISCAWIDFLSAFFGCIDSAPHPFTSTLLDFRSECTIGGSLPNRKGRKESCFGRTDPGVHPPAWPQDRLSFLNEKPEGNEIRSVSNQASCGRIHLSIAVIPMFKFAGATASLVGLDGNCGPCPCSPGK
jgi:hypothetical protein